MEPQMRLPSAGFANSAARMALVLGLPFFLLLLDVYLHPLLVASTESIGTADLTQIMTHGAVSLGRLRAHQIMVSIDAINDPDYLSFLQGTPNALVISTFVDVDKQAYGSGALQFAVRRRLKEVSPSDDVALQSLLERLRGFYAGQLLTLPLHIPVDKFLSFPLNYILIIALPVGHPETEDVESGLKRAFQQAERLGIVNIILPVLATNWKNETNNHLLSLGDLFGAMFDSINSGEYPRDIYVSLYKEWPTFQLENAAATLNEAWIKTTEDATDPVPLYRAEIRLTLIFLLLCLITCGFLVKYSVRTFLIVAVSFVTLAVGTKELFAFLSVDSGPIYGLFVRIGILAVLALGFPAIVSWNPKDIFKQKS
jgi:hypothetical protein